MKVETTPLSIKHIAEMYSVNGKHYAELYKNRLSNFHQWVLDEFDDAIGCYVNRANIGPHMSMDETCLSNGEVWTFITNKDAHGRKGTLAAAIKGTKSDDIIPILTAAFGKSDRHKVREITVDLSPSMMLIAQEVFPWASVVNDRFHVQQLFNEAIDEIRIDIRRELLKKENEKARGAAPEVCSNGETLRQILARSKHALMMSRNKWTEAHKKRVGILFRRYPILRQAYNLAMELRGIFNTAKDRNHGMRLLDRWFNAVTELANDNFKSVIKTIKNHYPTILNYFLRRATNASAEAFNSKVKIFRTQMRGVRDRDFFIFRLVKLYA